jgi:outer membrane protein assembly factor BamB
MHLPRCCCLLHCVLLLVLAQPVAGQQWTRFRGPNGCGQSDAATIPVTWTTKDYKWRVKLPGIGYSSPVIWGNRVFITSAIEEDATRIIRCLDTSDGSLIWKRQFASTTYKQNPLNSYAAATPAVDKDHVYLTWTTPQEYTLLALEQDKGGLVWRRNLGPYVAQHGSGASPIVFEDMVIVPNEQKETSSAVAIDCMTGQTRWKTDLPAKEGGYATPCIYQGDDGPPQLILACSEYGLVSLDPRTGRKNWQIEVFANRVVGSPVIVAGLIFGNCGQGGNGERLVAVRPGSAPGISSQDPGVGDGHSAFSIQHSALSIQPRQPELVYDNKRSMPYVPTPVAYGRLLFLLADSGVVTCMDAPTGKIRWQQRIGGNYFASPVRVGDRIYCTSRKGEMVVLAAADKYKLLSRINLEERSNSTPAIADGVMYLRTASHLMAIGGKTP